jgi:XTP/dITP diphosphohydrolase
MEKVLIIATNNKHKLEEISAMIGNAFELKTLTDIGCYDDIPETADTFEGNASLKSHYIFDRYHLNCFADDSGLEIEALNGEPGVYSARYAGTHGDHDANIDLVLKKMELANDRTAQFRTVISLIIDHKEYFFEGMVKGIIRRERSGTKGFGYDPIFQPDGYDITFAEMDLDEKNKISHRAIAIRKLIEFLKKIS